MAEKKGEILKENFEGLQNEIYEAKVRDLTEKLFRLKEKCDVLVKENDALGKAQAKFSSDKQDIVEFLNIKVREHEEHITVLEDKVRLQEEEMRELEMKNQADVESLRIESQHELETVQNQSFRYKSELDQLFDFKGRKDELEFQLRRTLTLLDTREKEYKDTIHSMERKVLQDKNQMKKEMLQKVNEAVANFRRVADQQMAETTKRAIRENMAITSQLKKMSAKTIDLLSENQNLTAKIAKLKISNSLLTESENELAKKNQANQRVIKMLVDRLKESDEMLEVAFEVNKTEKHEETPPYSSSNDLKFNVDNYDEGPASDAGIQDSASDMGENLRLREYDYFAKDLDALLLKAGFSDDRPDGDVNIESLRQRLWAALATVDDSQITGNAPTDKAKIRREDKVGSKVDQGLASVISAIPSSGQGLDTAKMLPRSIGVQTLPVFFGIGGGIQSDSSQKITTLLAEVRPWGPPALCIPRKGTKRIQIPRHLPAV